MPQMDVGGRHVEGDACPVVLSPEKAEIHAVDGRSWTA